jgi:hypothetical protein
MSLAQFLQQATGHETKKRRAVYTTNLSTTPEFDCKVCQTLIFYSQPHGDPVPHTSLHFLKASAEHGCVYCCLLRNGLQHYCAKWHGSSDDEVIIQINGDRARNDEPVYDSVLVTVSWTANASAKKTYLELELYRTEGKFELATTFTLCLQC